MKRVSATKKSVAQVISFDAIAAGAITCGVIAATGGLAALPTISALVLAATGFTAAAKGNVALKDKTGYSLGLTDLDRVLFNDFLGYWYTFSNPEDDVDIINLMFSVVFGGDSLNLEKGRDISSTNWYGKLPQIYSGLYEKALENRVRKWCQIAEYSQLFEQNTKGYLNLKTPG